MAWVFSRIWNFCQSVCLLHLNIWRHDGKLFFDSSLAILLRRSTWAIFDDRKEMTWWTHDTPWFSRKQKVEGKALKDQRIHLQLSFWRLTDGYQRFICLDHALPLPPKDWSEDFPSSPTIYLDSPDVHLHRSGTIPYRLPATCIVRNLTSMVNQNVI